MNEENPLPIVALVDELKEQISEITTDPMFKVKGAQVKVKFQVSDARTAGGGIKLMVFTAEAAAEKSETFAHEIVLDLEPIEKMTLGG